MENTCPLCKARFHTIDRVNTDISIRTKRKKCDVSIGGESEDTEGGGVGVGVGEHHQQLAGCDGKEEEVRSSKRVRTRNQRSDVHNYSSLESIFGKIDREREKARENGGRVVVLLLAAAAPNVKLTIFEYFPFRESFFTTQGA